MFFHLHMQELLIWSATVGSVISYVVAYSCITWFTFLCKFLMLYIRLYACRLDQSIAEECYEFLLLVAGASGNGKSSFYQPGVMDMLASHVYSLQDGIC